MRLLILAVMLAVPAAARDAPAPSLAVAAAAARSGQAGMAAKFYRDAVRATPLDAAAWLGLGIALARDDQLGEALAAFERAGDLAPALPGLARARGHAQLAARLLPASEASFRAASVQEPADPRGWVGLGVVLDLENRHAEAQAAYVGALRADPLNRAARNDLALSQALDGRLVEATATLALWANNADAAPRMRANLALLRAAATTAPVGPAGSDPALVAALRARVRR